MRAKDVPTIVVKKKSLAFDLELINLIRFLLCGDDKATVYFKVYAFFLRCLWL